MRLSGYRRTGSRNKRKILSQIGICRACRIKRPKICATTLGDCIRALASRRCTKEFVRTTRADLDAAQHPIRLVNIPTAGEKKKKTTTTKNAYSRENFSLSLCRSITTYKINHRERRFFGRRNLIPGKRGRLFNFVSLFLQLDFISTMSLQRVISSTRGLYRCISLRENHR